MAGTNFAQSIGVQLHQPLTLLYVALPAGQILRVPGIHQVHLQPACSRMSYTATQYTPVDCMATVRILHCFSQTAIALSSAVVHPNSRTDWLSRLGGTAT